MATPSTPSPGVNITLRTWVSRLVKATGWSWAILVVPRPHHEDDLRMVLSDGRGHVAGHVAVVAEPPSRKSVQGHGHLTGGLQGGPNAHLSVVHHAVADGHDPERIGGGENPPRRQHERWRRHRGSASGAATLTMAERWVDTLGAASVVALSRTAADVATAATPITERNTHPFHRMRRIGRSIR